MQWKIYYDDGTTWSDEDGPLRDAPSDGVQGCVIVDPDVGRRVWHGCDFYFQFTNGEIGFTNDLGPQLRHVHRIDAILFGRWVPDAEYKGTLKRMTEDPDFPVKSGRIPRLETNDHRKPRSD